MKNLFKLICLLICLAFVAGCTSQPVATTQSPTAVPPTAVPPTAEPTAVPTEAPAAAEPLTASFKDPVSAMEIKVPEGWTPVSNTGSVGVTALSKDWAGIAVFTLVYQDVKAVDAELTAMQEAQKTSKDFANAVITPGATATVFGKEWPAYTWTGYYTAVAKDYTGLDTAVPYGKNVVHITAYAPTDQWAKYELTLRAILNSLVEPAADFAYVPPIKTTDWKVFASDEFALSVAYPPDWQTPIAPWVDQGLWLNAADWMTSVVIWVKDGTDATKMLTDWGTTQTIFPTLTVKEGEPVKVMGAEYPSMLGEGKNGMGTDINCGVTMVPYNGKMLEILWYAGSGDYWTKGQDVFPGILASIQGLTSYTSDTYKLTLSYPANWIAPTEPWTGKGIWLNAADYMTSVIIWQKDGTDAAKALEEWVKTYEAGQGVFPSVTITDGQPVTIMGVEYPTKLCDGKNSMGTAIKCGVTMVPYDGKMLEILWYAGAEGYWDAGQQVFPAILSSIKAK